MNPHSYRLKGRDFVHQGKIEIDVNERAVFIRTQGCFFVYTNSDCFLNSCVHYNVGKEVRTAIEKIGGTMPEDLPTPEKSIQQIEKEQMQRLKNKAKKGKLMLDE